MISQEELVELAKNELDPDILDELSLLGIIKVNIAILGNPNTSPDTIKRFIDNEEFDYTTYTKMAQFCTVICCDRFAPNQ